jgi:ribosome-associated protein
MTEPPISKSERKRLATRLQKMGRALAELRPDRLAEISLPEDLERAIADYRRFPSREAKRRQLQLIGKLMREIDTAPIEAALERLDGRSATARYEQHQLERWRERLVEDPAALTDYLAEHPHSDRQALRHLIERARTARDEQQQKIASRALFRFLREEEHSA